MTFTALHLVKAAFLFASLKIALFRTNKKNNSHSLGVFGSINSRKNVTLHHRPW
jgi:hypothetical protein